MEPHQQPGTDQTKYVQPQTYKSWIFQRLLLIAGGLTISGPLADALLWLFTPNTPGWNPTSWFNVVILVLLIGLWYVHRRWMGVSEIVFMLICIVAVMVISYFVGGTLGPVPITYMLIILGTGLILHPRMTFFAAALVIGIYITMATLEVMGVLRPMQLSRDRGQLHAFTHVIRVSAFACQAALGWLMARTLLQTLSLAHQREEQLQQQRAVLEQQVAERTMALSRAAEEAERRADQLALLNDSIRHLAGNLELDTLLNKTVTLIYERFRFSSAQIMLVEYRPEPLLVLAAMAGDHGGTVTEYEYTQRIGEGIIGQAALLGQPYLASDVKQDPFFLVPPAPLPEVGAELAVPIKRGGRVLGVLDVQDRRANAFSEGDVRMLGALASQLAVAIEQARLYRNEQQGRRMAEGLYAISETLTASFDLQQVLPRVLHQITSLLSANGAAIWLLEQERFRCVAQAGGLVSDARPLQSTEVPLLVEISSRRQPLAFDTTTWMAQRNPGLGLFAGGSWVGAPLLHEGRLVGLLAVASVRSGFFQNELVELIGTFAHQAAQAIVNAQLYQERAVVLEELSHAQDELLRAERMRGLGELAGGVAHDFNNLLTSILGNAELLLLDEDVPENRELLNVIVRAALDGADTVTRLREFARSRHTETRQLISLDQLARESLELTRPRLRSLTHVRGIPIEVALDLEEAGPVLVNPTELREVLVNLILNAMDAMPQGGTLTIRTWGSVTVACCTVSDTGIGIPEELQDRVFEPFFTTKGSNGTGLGLAVASDLIRHHGGRLALKSAHGQGTQFTFELPIASDHPIEAEQGSVVLAHSAGQLQVLIIDDEETICDALARMVRHLGHAAEAVTNPSEALALLQSERFDLVFTDLGMPEISGWEVLRGAQASPGQPKAVLMTGWGGHITEEEAQAGGAAYLMLKPFTLEQIRTVIAALTQPAPSP